MTYESDVDEVVALLRLVSGENEQLAQRAIEIINRLRYKPEWDSIINAIMRMDAHRFSSDDLNAIEAAISLRRLNNTMAGRLYGVTLCKIDVDSYGK